MKQFLKYAFALLFIIASITSCKNNDHKSDDGPTVSKPGDAPVKTISYSIINTFPHDTSSFTQGLIVYKGQMYEGTGGSDSNPVSSKLSRLMKIDIKTGKVQKVINLPGNFFGEGITVLNDTVYQLTWQQKVVFVYTLPDFKKVKEFPINTDGWGITHNGKELIVSDGSSNLYFYEPSTFRLLRTQSVTTNGELTGNLNELEFFDGFVYANQYEFPYILKIDPNSGQVVGRIDLTQLWNNAKSKNENVSIQTNELVPNGIAYDAETKKIYVTGKKWPELYEIQLGQ